MTEQVFCFLNTKFQLADYTYTVHFWGFVFTATYNL